ncbi:MAG: Single-stranded-DNA-specific exonuclease RecJ, partial [Planctomycetota bacterium]
MRREAADPSARGPGSGALLDRILAIRGIAAGERETFLKPSLAQMGHPSEMPGMRAAAEAFLEAVREGRRIAIYGDYDVDGVMASTILWHLAGALGAEPPQVYIPHRIEEGYGLNRGALERLREDGAELVVTVDCGVAAPDEAAYARELGLELVITDHHEPRGDGRLPEARAVVHPRVLGASGFGELCGAAVAWKLAWMTLEVWHGIARERPDEPQRARLPEVHRRALLHWLAFAAVGTVADIVPLVGENRAIVAGGLPLVHLTGNAGMDALLAEARLEGARVDAEAVAFQLAPRINAAGRMRHASLAADLFTSADAREAAARARELSRLNDQRRRDDRAIFEDAVGRVESRLGVAGLVKSGLVKSGLVESSLVESSLIESKPAKTAKSATAPRGIVLWDDREEDGWSLGIVGIVCSKLVERFACPTVLLTRAHDGFRGSGRSVDGIDLHGILESCSEHLTHFGGHAMAAGMGVADLAALERF